MATPANSWQSAQQINHANCISSSYLRILSTFDLPGSKFQQNRDCGSVDELHLLQVHNDAPADPIAATSGIELVEEDICASHELVYGPGFYKCKCGYYSPMKDAADEVCTRDPPCHVPRSSHALREMPEGVKPAFVEIVNRTGEDIAVFFCWTKQLPDKAVLDALAAKISVANIASFELSADFHNDIAGLDVPGPWYVEVVEASGNFMMKQPQRSKTEFLLRKKKVDGVLLSVWRNSRDVNVLYGHRFIEKGKKLEVTNLPIEVSSRRMSPPAPRGMVQPNTSSVPRGSDQ